MLEKMIKDDIIECVKTGKDVGRDILKLVLSEGQRVNAQSDEEIVRIITKLIQSNLETLKLGGHNTKLVKENQILERYLPTTISRDELKNHLSAIESELSQKTGGQKIGFAIKYLKGLSITYSMNDLRELLNES